MSAQKSHDRISHFVSFHKIRFSLKTMSTGEADGLGHALCFDVAVNFTVVSTARWCVHEAPHVIAVSHRKMLWAAFLPRGVATAGSSACLIWESYTPDAPPDTSPVGICLSLELNQRC